MATDDPRESFDLQVPQTPAAATVDGKARLVYELHLTNFSRDPLVLQGVDVLDRRGAILARLDEGSLAARLGHIGAAVPDDPLTMPQGARGVLYLELDLEGRLPETVEHRVVYRPGPTVQDSAEVRSGRAPVHQGATPVLGAPLRGGPWVAIYGPSWERGHRRVLYTVDGRARIPGRFAVDWMRVDDEGLLAPQGSEKIESAYGYGAEVLSVADAVVAAVRDGVAEAGTAPPRKRALTDGAGNYVVLRLPDGEHHVFYEHLAPGSVRVALGERVQRGQVIAAIGSTGDSSRPHLHFHVADRKSLLGSEGLPFVLESFTLLGSYAEIEMLGNQPWTPRSESAAGSVRERELPAPNVVLTFDEGVGTDE
jgi:hypothetical protein